MKTYAVIIRATVTKTILVDAEDKCKMPSWRTKTSLLNATMRMRTTNRTR